MARAFFSYVHPLKGRMYTVVLEQQERTLLENLATDIIRLIASDLGLDTPQLPGEADAQASESPEPDGSAQPLTSKKTGSNWSTFSAKQAAPQQPADPFDMWQQELMHVEAQVQTPHDSATSRLFPAGTKDAQQADEFRELTQPALADFKIQNLLLMCKDLVPDVAQPVMLYLNREEAISWMTGMSDIRLVIADRLGLENDDDSQVMGLLMNLEVPEDLAHDTEDPAAEPLTQEASERAYLAEVYEFFTWLQEGLVEALFEDMD